MALECPHRVLDLTHPQRSRRQQSQWHLGRHSQLAADPFSCRPRLRPAKAGCAQRADGAHRHAVAPAVGGGRRGDREVLVETGMAPGAVGRGVGEKTQRRDTETSIGPQRAQGPARQRVGRHHRVHVPRRGKGAGLGAPAQALGEPAGCPVRVLEVSEDPVEEPWGVAHRSAYSSRSSCLPHVGTSEVQSSTCADTPRRSRRRTSSRAAPS